MCLSVKGALSNWKLKDFRKMFRHEDGSFYTPQEAKEALIEELALGHDVIPMGNCDNFDYKKGCLGHAQAPAENKEETVNSQPTPQGRQLETAPVA